MLGLTHAGKTTILDRMSSAGSVITVPFVHSHIAILEIGMAKLLSWDVGGALKPLSQMKHLPNFQSVIFVVNACDLEQIEESRKALFQHLSYEIFSHAALLIFANKIGSVSSLSIHEIAERLHLNEIVTRRWHIQDCIATSGDGIRTGLDWIASVF